MKSLLTQSVRYYIFVSMEPVHFSKSQNLFYDRLSAAVTFLLHPCNESFSIISFPKEVSQLLNLCKIIIQIAFLYGIYLIGHWIQEALNLFVPGSVIGLIILFILLSTNVVREVWVEKGADFFLKHLTLFFIPATVGIINYFEVFSGKGFLLIVIVLVSTVLVMAGSGLVTQWMMRGKEVEHD
ncbi:CidA/LrgA family protein [Virgibacillus sp. JSM 102003]|uniref:CidA/LrgA family protein n=1 Tax=Virgibacillus sp. JSM 102003 TaxID=1562108 RepID=UPI0035C0DF17